jgi:hypothetical protein
MIYIEQHYKELDEIVNFKKSLNWQKHHHGKLNLKLKPSYKMQSYTLMNKASVIILKLAEYINNNCGRMADLEIESIDKLKDRCCNVSKEHREEAFELLEETVKYRMKHFTC